MATVAFIGLGTMGQHMARNIIRAGHSVAVYDIDQVAMSRFKDSGARLATSPGDASTDAQFIITVLPSSPHVREAVCGGEGIAQAMSHDALMIDMTTGAVADFLSLAETLGDRGLSVIDAAIGRTPIHAEAGTLLALVGGSDEQVERASPILSAMCEEVMHCGPLGAGVTTKIINNYLTVVSVVATAEALCLGAKSGINRDLLVRIIQSTVATNGAIETVFPRKVLAGDSTPLFAARLANKDVNLALELGAHHGVPMLTGAGARQAFALQQACGRMDEDMSMLLDVLERVTGVS